MTLQMTPQQILAEIDHLRRELAAAADDLLSAAEQGLTLAQTAPMDAEAVTASFHSILAACSFQDLADQRIARLLTALTGRKAAPRPDAALLNGPAMAGETGLNQSAADALLGS
ncbi:MAG: hypothetical protein P0Y52_11540 [Candidatus Brevundimonas phytovorans]|nr:hypothetical protein [Brevundimonas sp.]WEK57169.1 MAG: hypothetical protein P0Y52_11540 [Brevundimonas sp.]